MRRTSRDGILSEVFSVRISAVEELVATGYAVRPDAARLHQIAEDIRTVSDHYGEAPNHEIYSAFGDLIDVAALMIEWRATVLDAGIDAQRFLIAAKERLKTWLNSYVTSPAMARLIEVAKNASNVRAIDDVLDVTARLSAVPLPVGIHILPACNRLRVPVQASDDDESVPSQPPLELAVAFVTFSIDGRPLNEVHYVSPGETHDMNVEVRVSRWPKGATHLLLEPVTVEPPGTYHLPKFDLDAPMGELGPFRLNKHGRMMLSVPNHIQARPFEFKYTARFMPVGSEQPVEVTGQRTLLLEGVDIARNPFTGYPAIDKRLLDMRNNLRVVPHVDQCELSDALTVMIALGNFAGQVVQDNLFDTTVDEAEFQRRILSFLRSQPSIGSALEEHPRAAGGITDLSFKGIRIELKSEPHSLLALKDCQKFVGQTASYAVGTNKHLGILCVLDCSKKKQAPFPAEDGIGVFQHQHPDGTPVCIVTILIQGNLARPSSLSR